MRAGQAAVGISVALALGGCRSFAPAVLRPAPGEEQRVEVWLESQRSEAQQRRAIRAEGKLLSGAVRVKQVVLAERPARLRLETLNFLGHTQTLLVTDGERFSFFDGRELRGGEVFPSVLRETLGLDLDPEEAVSVLLAVPRLGPEPARAIWRMGERRIVDLDTQRLVFGPEGELLSIEVWDDQGATRWRAEYTDWRPVRGGRYPGVLSLFLPSGELAAELRLKEVEINPRIDPGLFRLPREGPE